jgi:hypothetical protein
VSEQEDGPNPRNAVMALVVILAIVLGGLWLSGELRQTASLQDCVMAGRTNCAPVHR